MGFLRRLFRAKKSDSPAEVSSEPPTKNKRRSWNFIKQSKAKAKSQIATSDLNQNEFAPNSSPLFADSLTANKHAIAVAAATAAVAEAALAAAAAAAEVVRLTGGGGSPSTSSLPAAALYRRPEEIAAVKIQSVFRRYLAKRALRALKALVKLQALVRGHIVRKQTADMLRRMHTLVRLQSRARASRVHLSHSVLHPNKSPLSHHPAPEYFDHPLRSFSTKFDGSSVLKRCSSNANFREIGSARANWFDNWMEENIWNHHAKDDDINDEKKSDKILEVDDTWKPPQEILKKSHQNENNKNVMMMMMGYEYDQSPSKRSTRRIIEQKASSRTAENSPEAFSFSSSRRKGPFTPTKSECGGYMAHPNYMSNTESSLAKVRSLSVPRQRHNSDLRTQQQYLTSSGSGLFSRIGSPNLR